MFHRKTQKVPECSKDYNIKKKVLKIELPGDQKNLAFLNSLTEVLQEYRVTPEDITPLVSEKKGPLNVVCQIQHLAAKERFFHPSIETEQLQNPNLKEGHLKCL